MILLPRLPLKRDRRNTVQEDTLVMITIVGIRGVEVEVEIETMTVGEFITIIVKIQVLEVGTRAERMIIVIKTEIAVIIDMMLEKASVDMIAIAPIAAIIGMIIANGRVITQENVHHTVNIVTATEAEVAAAAGGTSLHPLYHHRRHH